MNKSLKNTTGNNQERFSLIGIITMIITFLALVFALNMFGETRNFGEYKASIRSVQICNPHGPMYSSCSKTDNDLLNDYYKNHYGPLFIALITPLLYLLYKYKFS